MDKDINKKEIKLVQTPSQEISYARFLTGSKSNGELICLMTNSIK